MPNGDEYWHGQFEANIKTLFHLVEDLGTSMASLESTIHELNSWRWKLVGACAAISVVMSMFASLAIAWIGR